MVRHLRSQRFHLRLRIFEQVLRGLQSRELGATAAKLFLQLLSVGLEARHCASCMRFRLLERRPDSADGGVLLTEGLLV